MVDFKKLMERTPEERAADVEAAQQRFDAQQEALLAKRLGQLDAICQLPDLSEWERGFVRSMQGMRDDHDAISGRAGGQLLYLSDGRLRTFEALAARAQQPANRCQPGGAAVSARAARYRG